MWNPRYARDLVLRGDRFAVEGRLQEAGGLYVESIEIIGSAQIHEIELDPEHSVGIPLSRALGHERTGLVRVWTHDITSARQEFDEAEAALEASLAIVHRIPPEQAAIVEHVRVEAPLRWREMVRQEAQSYDSPPSVDITMGMKLCRHGWLSKTGFCRGHPPDPCL